jgi:hypothetical protein
MKLYLELETGYEEEEFMPAGKDTDWRIREISARWHPISI